MHYYVLFLVCAPIHSSPWYSLSVCVCVWVGGGVNHRVTCVCVCVEGGLITSQVPVCVCGGVSESTTPPPASLTPCQWEHNPTPSFPYPSLVRAQPHPPASLTPRQWEHNPPASLTPRQWEHNPPSFPYPSPVRAQHAWTCQPWSLIEVRLRCWDISAALIDPFTSCLLANMSTPEPFSSYGGRGGSI